MRILMLQTFPLWGSGSGTYARELARELARIKDIEVGIVCPDKRVVDSVKIFPVDLPVEAAFTTHPAYRGGGKRFADLSEMEIAKFYWAFLEKAIKACEKFRPHVIHAHHISVLMWVARFLKAIFGINFIATAHGTDMLNAQEDKRYVPLTRDALRSVRYIIANSLSTRNWLEKIFGFSYRNKLRVVVGGVNISDYPRGQKYAQYVTKKYHLTSKKVILYSGKLNPQKGVEFLIKAAPKIKGDIYIVGEGSEEEKLKSMAKSMKNVHFMGYFGKSEKNDLLGFYQRCDCLVVPSIWEEPMGLILLEAMACGKPVVATEKGGIKSIVKKTTGFLVPAKDAKAIARRVNKLLHSPKLAKKMGEAARIRVEKNFTWKVVAKKYMKFFRKAIPKNMPM